MQVTVIVRQQDVFDFTRPCMQALQGGMAAILRQGSVAQRELCDDHLTFLQLQLVAIYAGHVVTSCGISTVS